MQSGRAAGPAAAKRPPTGHCRKSFGHFDAATTAATFSGIREGEGHPKRLLEPLRRLGARLPFPREALATLELLFDYSRPEHWREGARPLVYPGNAELAGCLGVSERTVRNHLRALQAAGVIHVERGPGNRRTPIRDGRGAVVAAYGIDLSPVRAGSEGWVAQAAEMARRRQRLKETMRSVTVAVQDIRTAFDALDIVAAERPDEGGLAQAAMVAADALRRAEGEWIEARRLIERDPCHTDEQDGTERRLATLAEGLTRLAGEINLLSFERLSPVEAEKTSGQAETGFREKTTTSNQSSYSARQDGVAGFIPSARPPVLPGIDTVSRPESARPTSAGLAARRVVAVHPPRADILRDYLLIDDPGRAGPGDVVDASRILALRMGLSEWAWRTGCERHGREAAALAAVVAAAKPAHEIRVGRASFLAGMLLREPRGLNVLASYHALRKRLAAAKANE
ncbi:MAG: HTH domain-containing protein [Alphaproteobacteria bacterium]|nr:HTH domain-containing protein [Alphaproteobacteria bacterium]